jgi:hypothetical protein
MSGGLVYKSRNATYSYSLLISKNPAGGRAVLEVRIAAGIEHRLDIIVEGRNPVRVIFVNTSRQVKKLPPMGGFRDFKKRH